MPFRSRTGWSPGALAIPGLVIYSILLNLGVFQADAPVAADSPPFLRVIELLSGNYHGIVAPFRILYPVYPYLAWLTGRFVPDVLLSARLASVIAAVVCPVLVFAACRILRCGRGPSFLAGFILASWPPLIGIARVPLYDSTFVCMTAACLVSILAALRSRSTQAFLGAAVVCGVAAATRGPGLFFPAAFLVPLLATGGVTVTRKALIGLVGALGFVSALWVVRLPAERMAAAFGPDKQECVRQVIADGILMSEGIRDSVTYTVGSNCAEFADPTRRACALSWPDFIRMYGKRWGTMTLRNWKRLAFEDLTNTLSPFLVFFIPLALGIYQRLKYAIPGNAATLAIVLMAFPLLVIVPAMQSQPRYFYPLIVFVAVIAGCGFDFALHTLSRRANAILVAGCLGLAFAAAVDTARNDMRANPEWANYRAASTWITRSPDYSSSANVMAREWGLYPYLGKSVTKMPVDKLDRLLCNAKANGVRFILVGPTEREHSAYVAAYQNVPGLQPVRSFGQGSDAVQVLRVQD